MILLHSEACRALSVPTPKGSILEETAVLVRRAAHTSPCPALPGPSLTAPPPSPYSLSLVTMGFLLLLKLCRQPPTPGP